MMNDDGSRREGRWSTTRRVYKATRRLIAGSFVQALRTAARGQAVWIPAAALFAAAAAMSVANVANAQSVETAASSPSSPSANVTPAPASAPTPTPATSPAPRVARSEVGHATLAWLDLQRSNAQAAPSQPMLGDEAGLAYRRYMESFKSKIPELFGSALTQGGGQNGGGAQPPQN